MSVRVVSLDARTCARGRAAINNIFITLTSKLPLLNLLWVWLHRSLFAGPPMKLMLLAVVHQHGVASSSARPPTPCAHPHTCATGLYSASAAP